MPSLIRITCIAAAPLAFLAACSPITAPSAAPEEIATIVAATQRAAPTWTASPVPSATATLAPTATPTPVEGTPVAPTRVALTGGAMSAVIRGHIGPGESHAYAVRGSQGQPMLVQLDSGSGDASLSMMSKGGTFFIRPGAASSWRGPLPEAGDYYFGVYPGSEPTDYRLSIQLATRIRFKEDETHATFTGASPDGATAAFSLFCEKGQQLDLTLSGAEGNAVLSLFGFRDDVSYLSADEHEFSYRLVIPSRQDYIIEIVPDPGETVHYVLDVNLQ